MPYDAKSGQALAVFLSIKRKKGLAAAKAFGRKHRADLSAAAHERGAAGQQHEAPPFVSRKHKPKHKSRKVS